MKGAIKMIQLLIQKLLDGNDLLNKEMQEAMNIIMEGRATEAQMGAFLTALRAKGESEEEIAAGAKIMREKALKLDTKNYAIDTCGTGGDKSGTFNISTLVAIIAAACGVSVLKHGNRSVSSKSGSADVLEALGININLSPEQVAQCVDIEGIGFMFAPHFHPSMKNVASVRKELGTRTIFNVLGPLTNPAHVKGQIVGTYEDNLTEKLAFALKALGTEHAMVVHGLDGLDEITTTTQTKVSELKNDHIKHYYISPEQFGLNHAKTSDLLGGDSITNAAIIHDILEGEKGPKRDITVMNAAAALYVGKKSKTLKEGIVLAEKTIDSGLAKEKLQRFIEVSKRLSS